jgi:hypothetical protein
MFGLMVRDGAARLLTMRVECLAVCSDLILRSGAKRPRLEGWAATQLNHRGVSGMTPLLRPHLPRREIDNHCPTLDPIVRHPGIARHQRSAPAKTSVSAKAKALVFGMTGRWLAWIIL